MQAADSFDSAANYLDSRLRAALVGVDSRVKESAYEIRLRSARPVVIVTRGGSLFVYGSGRTGEVYSPGALTASPAELQASFSRMCGYSVHSNSAAAASGFISLAHGHRAGVCGTAVMAENGTVRAFRDISSVNLRIAHEVRGAADEIYTRLFNNGAVSAIIAGPPLSGKTTLLRTLCGELPPLSGEIEKGDTVRIGYFAQHCPALDPDTRIIDAVKDVAVHVYTPDGDLSASHMSETFLYQSQIQNQKVSSLSGGEQRRLYLLRILMAAPNVLILAAPTNALNLATLNILEDYLDSFQGAIIAVSHDRYFLDRLTTHLFAVEDAHMVPYIGGYQSYLDAQEAKAEAMADMKQPAAAKPKATRVRVQTQLKFSYKEQRDFDTIENRVAELEEKLAQLEKEIAANASDYTKVTELMDTQAKTQQELDEATERWLFLQEKWEQIQAQKG